MAAGALLAIAELILLVPSGPAGATAAGSITTVEAPLPSGAGGAPSVSVTQVVCPAAGTCVAVGQELTASTASWPAIEGLSSGSWSVVEAPLPAAAAPPASPEHYAVLNSVACASTTSCVAVGVYNDSSGHGWGFIDTLSNGSWSAASAPEPSGAGTDADGYQQASLNSVSCPVLGSCIAVGDYETPAESDPGMIETLSSGTWTASTAPASSGLEEGTLYSVSCIYSTSLWCMAVGQDYSTSGGFFPIMETFSGSSWAFQKGTLPSSGTLSGFLNHVSCPTTTSCAASGTYQTGASSDYAIYGLLDVLSSGTWTPTKAPVPTGGTAQRVNAVSCGAAGACIAGGFYTDSNGHETGLVETLSSNTWTATAAAQPANAGTDTGGTQNDDVTAVSCTSATACVAVGGYETTGGSQLGLIDTLSGSSWSALAAPQAGNAGSAAASLAAVTCQNACVAVGTYHDSSSRQDGLLEVLGSGSWSASEAPLTSEPTTDPDLVISAESCTSSAACVAVGSAVDASGSSWGVIETLAGGSWSAAFAPEPAGAGSDAAGTEDASLAAVSCSSAGSCVAVGSYEDSSKNTWGLIDKLSAGSWSAVQAPLPSGGSDGDLDAVSCPSASSCVAVGSYTDSDENIDGLIETLSSGSWSTIEAPQPSNAATFFGDTTLVALNCPAVGSCVAVGAYYDSNSLQWGLIDTLSGSSWSDLAAPEPSNAGSDASGYQQATLAGVSCPTSTACVAVGAYDDSSGHSWGLIDTLSGASWSTVAASEPSGAGSGTDQMGSLAAVSCPTSVSCVAVGAYDDSSGKSWGLIDTLSAGTWSGTQAAEPSGAGTDSASTQSAQLAAVACPSTAWCVAAGSYEDASGFTWGELETGSALSWTAVQLPEPSDAGTDAALDQAATAHAVSCAGEGSCEVAASYLNSGPGTESVLNEVLPPAPTVVSVSPSSGPAAGGTTVTVSGSWFFPAATSSFGSVTYQSPSSLQVLSPGGAGAVDVEVTTAGGTSPAVAADQFTYPGGSFAVEASPSLYWDFALDGYDQWASASASALSGCTGDGDGTVCSAGTQPVLEVLDTTGAHAGWSLSAYVTGGSLPAGSVLDFDGAGSAALGTSAQAALEAFPYPSAVPTTICDANSGCLPALPAASCSHPAVGITSCPADPVDVLDGASAGAQVDLYSAAAGSGSASICFATGTATAAGCLGAVPDAFFDLGLPASAASGSHSATTIVLTVSSGP